MKKTFPAILLVFCLCISAAATADSQSVIIGSAAQLREYLFSLPVFDYDYDEDPGDYILMTDQKPKDALLVEVSLWDGSVKRISADELYSGYRIKDGVWGNSVTVELSTDLVLSLKGGSYHAESFTLDYGLDISRPTVTIVYSDGTCRYTYTVATDEWVYYGGNMGTQSSAEYRIDLTWEGILEVMLNNADEDEAYVPMEEYDSYAGKVRQDMWTFADGSSLLQEDGYFIYESY